MQQNVSHSEQSPSENHHKTVNTDWESEATKAAATLIGATMLGASVGDAIAGDKGAIPGALVGATFGAGLRAYGFLTDRDTKEVTLAVTHDGKTVEINQQQRSPMQNAATLIGGTLLFATIANASSSLPYVTYAGASVGFLVASMLIYQAYRRAD